VLPPRDEQIRLVAEAPLPLRTYIIDQFFALGSGARPVTKPGTQPDKVAGRADNEAPAVPRSKASAGDE